MKHIDITEMEMLIEGAPVEMPLCFIGDTGIGKTQVIKKYAEDRNIYLKTLILSQIEASECLGIPVQSTREFRGRTVPTITTAVPSWVFDLAEQPNSMLYLDEFLCAEPSVMNSFLNFITEKKVNGIDLSHVKIIAATNIGNYTYEPDNNIISRFSWFYVQNKSYNDYLKNKYQGKFITNDYIDEEELDGVIFETHSLKPRCQELLCMVKNKDLIEYYYEGFTNSVMKPVFHRKDKLNEIIKAFAVKDKNGDWTIPEDDVKTVAGMLYKATCTSKKKNIIDYATRLDNIKYNELQLKTLYETIKISTES